MGDSAAKSPAGKPMTPAEQAWVAGFLRTKASPNDAGGGAKTTGGHKGAPDATATDLFFEKDSAALTPSDRATLDAYAKAYLAAGGTGPVTVEAWASKEGDEKHNKDLANARAKAVADYLAGQKLPKGQIKATGHEGTDKFSKDDLAQNRRATLAPPPPAAPAGGSQAPAGPSPEAKPGGGDPHMPKDGLHMRDKGDGRPTDTQQQQEDAARKVVGESTDVPRATVIRELKDWLGKLAQAQKTKTVRTTDRVWTAEGALRDGIPGDPFVKRGDNKDYAPDDLAEQIGNRLPDTIPAENFAKFRKMKPVETKEEGSVGDQLHRKYEEERNDFVHKLPKSWQGPATKIIDAGVEKGSSAAVEKLLGASGMDSKLQGEVKDFIDKMVKKMTGDEDKDDK